MISEGLLDEGDEFFFGGAGQQLLEVVEHPLEGLLRRAVTLACLMAQQLLGCGE